MNGMDERSLQNGICERLAGLGWELTRSDSELGRRVDDVISADDLSAALVRLNPQIAAQPAGVQADRVQTVLAKLRAILLSANDGLVAANEELTAWMCGRRTIQYVGADQHEQVRLVDFEHPRANTLRVSTEATYRAGREQRRYDIVLWVNGLPLVVGETKKPGMATSWLNAATDIHNGYERKTPAFFVPNVLSFATDGRDFRYGAIRQPPEMWLKWAKTTDPIAADGLPSVIRSAELLLTPEMILEILRHFTLYSSRRTTQGAQRHKIIPRYPQVEAVESIVARCLDPHKRQGLVWHHQGSGKTLAMAFAAAKLQHVEAMDAPTIVVVLDRLDLIEQTAGEFRSVDIPTVKVARTREELREMLDQEVHDTRGVIITTIYRFKDAGESKEVGALNDRANIVVMVDEAHRTQEGRLGLDMRAALPNAKFIGLTGTPIATDDRNTWDLFGDGDDPDGVLNHYSVQRSVHDGATLPVRVETRLVSYHLDSEKLQEAVDELAEDEELDDEQREVLARKAGNLRAVMQDPDRIEAVCADIVNHYRTRMAPLGLKAQVVAYDRATCVAYHEAISALLRDGEEATVVMTTAKDDPPGWENWDRDRTEEAIVKDRFRDIDDPLKFLIVTAKLLTGFDAPIEGVMYLDKPLRAHTLFQAVCRTNRRWTHPHTGQQKTRGLIVDYMGLGEELAKAVAVKPREPGVEPAEGDLDALIEDLAKKVEETGSRFSCIDRNQSQFDQILEAQAILTDENGGQDEREAFATEFLRCQELFEFLHPELGLKQCEDDYRFLAKVYQSIAASNAADMQLWRQLSAKTMAIVHEHISGFDIGKVSSEGVVLDDETLQGLSDCIHDLDLSSAAEKGRTPPTASEVIERLEGRIRARMTGSDPHRNWRNLSERLEELRTKQLVAAATSAEQFNELLRSVGVDIRRTERADDEGGLDEIRIHNSRTRQVYELLREAVDKASPDGPEETDDDELDRVAHELDKAVDSARGRGVKKGSKKWREAGKRIMKILNSVNLATSTVGSYQVIVNVLTGAGG